MSMMNEIKLQNKHFRSLGPHVLLGIVNVKKNSGKIGNILQLKNFVFRVGGVNDNSYININVLALMENNNAIIWSLYVCCKIYKLVSLKVIEAEFKICSTVH